VKLHLKSIAALILSVIAYLPSPAAVAGDGSVVEASRVLVAASDLTSTVPPAIFFTINEVLAKIDRRGGRGPDAIRLASLVPSYFPTGVQQPPLNEESAAGTEPFGLFVFRAPEGILWRKWRGVESDMIKDRLVLDRCRAHAETCPSHAAQFLLLINAVTSKSGRAQLDEVNRAVNAAIRYVTDFVQYGEADRWSAPLETFVTGKGDCEDYAIAKYVALQESGFPSDDLRLVLVRDGAVRQDHAVLTARLGGRWLILDNRRAELIEDTGASNFTPLFAIDHGGVHLFAASYASRNRFDAETARAVFNNDHAVRPRT
jgi:predicted transglutaminase-like cysteine proteinase